MSIESEYCSPDGLLRFVVDRKDGDVSLGFAGYPWHTHADILAGSFGLSEREAIDRFVRDLLDDRLVIAVSRVGGLIQGVWITDDPRSDVRFKDEEEAIEFRYWTGNAWQAS